MGHIITLEDLTKQLFFYQILNLIILGGFAKRFNADRHVISQRTNNASLQYLLSNINVLQYDVILKLIVKLLPSQI